jgi:carboxypeptidase C (cathepsin A)
LASILFVDSPVGSGFSYAHDPKGYDVGDISSSMQIVKFLRKVETKQASVYYKLPLIKNVEILSLYAVAG